MSNGSHLRVVGGYGGGTELMIDEEPDDDSGVRKSGDCCGDCDEERA